MSCLRALKADELRYHPRCLRALFDSSVLPSIDVELAKLHTLALAMVGHTSLSGVQRKISLGFVQDRTTLTVAVERGRYILKPQAQTFPALPENEHLTMCLANEVKIQVPPFALVHLKDGSLAYIVRRFDRTEQGAKRRQEDFCQLAGKSPKDKYQGSAELCVRLLKRYASEPLVELLELYRRLVFCWWTGNGDMHLKNFSILTTDDGTERLSPAYDLLSTRLVIDNDPLALSVGEKKDSLTRRKWLEFAEYCTIPRVAAERVLREMASALERVEALVSSSFLPAEMKASYVDLLRTRSRVLAPTV